MIIEQGGLIVLGKGTVADLLVTQHGLQRLVLLIN